MARAQSFQEMSDPVREPQPGEWQALRGELVALLDQVEGRYAQAEKEQPEPALSGLTERVRHLRDQVETPEPVVRRQQALRTVKRAVDRFSDRDETAVPGAQPDALTSAIAEIRGRQMSSSAAALGSRPADMPEFRELNGLVGGISGRLERLEVELKAQRTGNGGVREVASQVEQLTHVVELLAGAVGETGQVKRLESQIGALAALIEEGPKVDLTTINKRLDDVSATVGKLAELQAEQMEREIVREDARAAEPRPEPASALTPAMHGIEKSVRNVYDRIDSIEKNVALSSGDFERLTSEMAAFTQAMKDRDTAPNKLMGKVDALAAQIAEMDAPNGDVIGLKDDIAALQAAVLAGMEPRFGRIESQIEELSGRIPAPTDTSEVEAQLKLLMQRMDDTSAQLDNLAQLYATPADIAGMEAMATLVAERTTDAMARKAPAPVAMFGADSLKSIEDRISGLVRSVSKGPDYETIAEMVAEKTSAAVARSAPAPTDVSQASMSALEERVTALLNTTGKDTAERLTRLEAAIAERAERAAAEAKAAEIKAAEAKAIAATPPAAPAADPMATDSRADRLDSMLSALGATHADPISDAMPANPADDAPLLDPGFKDPSPVWAALDKMGAASTPAVTAAPLVTTTAAATGAIKPLFDPASAERPPRPQSSFALTDADPFATPPAPAAAPQVEAPVSQSSTSTFVAAARRAQRARQEAEPTAPATGNSVIGRALSRFRPAKPGETTPPENADAAVAAVLAEPKEKPAKAEKPAKPIKEKKVKAAPVEAIAEPVAPAFGAEISALDPQPSFLARHRRPLLLTAALVVVSLLALNLMLNRAAETPAPAVEPSTEIAPEVQPATPLSEPVASQDVSLIKPEPRIIDMVDNTTTASIASTAGFTTPTGDAASMPQALASAGPVVEPMLPEMPAVAAEPFELPAEAVGPLELRQAAADGDARAQFEIAAIYTEGRAVEQDYLEAAKWYERSAVQGLVPAQYRLGNLYETGTGVDKDLEVAKVWYQRAADAGNRMAMHNLAALYASGELGDQQFESAAQWFQQAADRGMTDSQFNLGMLYARGLGVEQDFGQSFKWFSLAASSGDADAAKARDDIAKSLTAETVSQVDAELAAWTSQPIDLAANFAPIGTWSTSFDPGSAIATRDVVSKVQEVLSKLGFDVGTPDGLAGPKTADAIKSFERSTGMSESGAVNPRLLAVLGSQPV